MTDIEKVNQFSAAHFDVSISPNGRSFAIPDEHAIAREAATILSEAARQRSFGRKIVVVQGLGFVGTAVAAVIAAARDARGEPRYFVVGVDLPSPSSFWKIALINEAVVPFPSPDPDFENLIREAVQQTGNLRATASQLAYEWADFIVIDVNLDAAERIVMTPSDINVDMDGLQRAVRVIGQRMQPGALVLVETTVPVGACEHVVEPLLRAERARRGITQSLKLAHSYERVMPGPQYVDSIRHFWRSYSGVDAASADAAEEFLSSFIDTHSRPLCRLDRPVATELAKLLENSYRAVNIAFMHEWTLLAEQVEVNLFDIVESIRVRKGTHDNMRHPGFGVGGYCLTKDSYLAQWGAKHLFNVEVTLEMTLAALRINYLMPRHTFNLLNNTLGGQMKGVQVAVLGVSYLPEVGDTRNSPTELLVDDLSSAGAIVALHDPLVKYWRERPDVMISEDLETVLRKANAIVLAVPHNSYRALSADRLMELAPKARAVVDAQNMLSDASAQTLVAMGRRVVGVGKGHWRRRGYHLGKQL